jgi:hypothetical protein
MHVMRRSRLDARRSGLTGGQEDRECTASIRLTLNIHGSAEIVAGRKRRDFCGRPSGG